MVPLSGRGLAWAEDTRRQGSATNRRSPPRYAKRSTVRLQASTGPEATMNTRTIASAALVVVVAIVLVVLVT